MVKYGSFCCRYVREDSGTTSKKKKRVRTTVHSLILFLTQLKQGVFPSELEIFLLEGSTCENLSCITSLSSEQSWKIRAGENLWLALKFYRGGERSLYGLTLEEIECFDNDVCESGKLITEVPAIERSGKGILRSSNFNRNGTVSSSLCQVFGYTYQDFQTFWYEFTLVGEGCMSATVFGTSDVALGVHEGDSCDDMGCVTMAAGYSIASASWKIKSGKTYHVGIKAYGVSDFVLFLDDEECADLQSNFECSNLQVISDSPVTGSPGLAMSLPLSDTNYTMKSCDFSGIDMMLWYEIDPTPFGSSCLTLDFSGDIFGGYAILEGTGCDSFECVYTTTNGPDDSITFSLDPLKTYYVVVFESWRREGAKFSLKLSEGECNAPQSCEEPYIVEEMPFVDTLASRALAFDQDTSLVALSSCDGIANLTGYQLFWYSFTGTGVCLSAIVWSNDAFFVGLYRGSSCGELSCVGRKTIYRPAASINFFAGQGETYRLLVGSRAQSDDTIVSLTPADGSCQTISVNSFCGSAKPITKLDHVEMGDLQLAGLYGDYIGGGSCSVYGQSHWYTLSAGDFVETTNETCVQASLNSTMGWVELNIFVGNDCDSMLCLGHISYPGQTNCKFCVVDTRYLRGEV